ncbi:fibronectin type-III domain-containing protein 3a isoform X4 [Biomphalaria glabrata]|nr:fibronectin type-III domain-containing protein 3a isoform X4 [Biomphalaria glabrata]
MSIVYFRSSLTGQALSDNLSGINMMEDSIEPSQSSRVAAKSNCNGNGNSFNGLTTANGAVTPEELEENGLESAEHSEHVDSDIVNNNNNTDSITNINDSLLEQESDDANQTKSNGLISDTPSPVSEPPSPPLCTHQVPSPVHGTLNSSGHYSPHMGPGYYLGPSGGSMGHVCMSSPNPCASPPGSYPSSNASHSGGSGTHSRGDSPGEGGGGSSPPSGQHVVHVHVNPGETFSVRLGDQIQHIQGKSVNTFLFKYPSPSLSKY